jgi:hypothetical protein
MVPYVHIHRPCHASFVTERNLFGINHYAGCSLRRIQIYSIQHLSLCCAILLFSGPSLAAERHSKDDQIVQAQVSSRPLRIPSPVLSPNNTLPAVQDEHPRLDPGKTYLITTKLNLKSSLLLNVLNFGRSHVFDPTSGQRLWFTQFIRQTPCQISDPILTPP